MGLAEFPSVHVHPEPGGRLSIAWESLANVVHSRMKTKPLEGFPRIMGGYKNAH